jgi:hypothetical protein
MKITLSTEHLTALLRQNIESCWSYNGARVLADFLEIEEAAGDEELEFDPEAIRKRFTEYDSASQCLRELHPVTYAELSEKCAAKNKKESPEQRERLLEESFLEALREHLTVIEVPGWFGVIVSSY